MQERALNRKFSSSGEFVWRIQNITKQSWIRFIEEGYSNYYASVLTNATFLLLVPIAIVLLGIALYMGIGPTILQKFNTTLAPFFNPELSEYINDGVLSLFDQTKNLILVSFFVLLTISLVMLSVIDDAVNKIFKVKKDRKRATDFVLYWSILTLCPLLIGGSFIIDIYQLSSTDEVNFSLLKNSKFAFILMTSIYSVFFTLLYSTVPNCRVRFSHALTGGISAAIVSQTLKIVMLGIINFFSISEAIYMFFCISAVSFLWVYLNWAIFFSCALLVYGLTFQINEKNTKHLPLPVSTLVILSVVLSYFKSGKATEYEDLKAEGWKISHTDWHHCTSWLVEQQLVSYDQEGKLILSRSLEIIKLSDVFDKIPWPLPTHQHLNKLDTQNGLPAWFKKLIHQLKNVSQSQNQLLCESLACLYSSNQINIQQQTINNQQTQIDYAKSNKS